MDQLADRGLHVRNVDVEQIAPPLLRVRRILQQRHNDALEVPFQHRVKKLQCRGHLIVPLPIHCLVRGINLAWRILQTEQPEQPLQRPAQALFQCVHQQPRRRVRLLILPECRERRVHLEVVSGFVHDLVRDRDGAVIELGRILS